MSAFDTTGPSRLFTRTELANAQKAKRVHMPGAKLFDPMPTRFSQPIVSKAASDRTNAIRNSCFFYDEGDKARKALANG